MFKLIKHVERPSKCSLHEKCTLMLLNEMYTSCGYIKAHYTQFDTFAIKIRSEKIFSITPAIEKFNLNLNNLQMKPDEKLTSMITTTK